MGSGCVGPRDVVYSPYPELRRTPRGPRMVPGFVARAPVAKPKGGAGSAPLVGLGAGIAVHFAGCCHPLPGDRIVGVVATGKGVTIHTATCQTLESFADTPERFLDVDWDYAALSGGGSGTPAEPFVGRVTVIAANEPAALATITNAVSKQHGSIVNLKIVHRQLDFMEVLVDIEVRDLKHLSSVIGGLRSAEGISQVERARS